MLSLYKTKQFIIQNISNVDIFISVNILIYWYHFRYWIINLGYMGEFIHTKSNGTLYWNDTYYINIMSICSMDK